MHVLCLNARSRKSSIIRLNNIKFIAREHFNKNPSIPNILSLAIQKKYPRQINEMSYTFIISDFIKLLSRSTVQFICIYNSENNLLICKPLFWLPAITQLSKSPFCNCRSKTFSHKMDKSITIVVKIELLIPVVWQTIRD